MRPIDGSLMAMPRTPVKDINTPWNGNIESSYACPLVPKDDGTFVGLEVSGLVPYGDDERDHTLQKDLNAERWPYGYLLPFSDFPAKNDHLHGIPLGVASPN